MIEITTFRVESKYSDGRRPDEVIFVKSLQKDLARRDFTINALALDLNGRIIDYFDGLRDLREKRIAAVGNAIDRFQEDALRMLRAVRFALRLGFSIENSTEDAILTFGKLIISNNISGERILVELEEILGYPSAIELLHQLSLLTLLFPKIKQLNQLDKLLIKSTQLATKGSNSNLGWALIIRYSILRMSEDEIEHVCREIYTRYPGLGRYREEIIKNLVRSSKLFGFILDHPCETEFKYYIISVMGKLDRFPEFDPQLHLSELIDISEIIHGSSLGISGRKQLMSYIPVINPNILFNGHDVRKQGFSGPNISRVLKEIDLLYLRKGPQSRKELEEFVSALKDCSELTLTLLRQEYSKNCPSFSELENKYLRRSIIRRLHLSSESPFIIRYSQKETALVSQLKKLSGDFDLKFLEI